MKIELPFKKDAGKLDNQTFFNSLGRAEAPAIRLLAKKISYGVRQAAALASLQPEDAEELVNEANRQRITTTFVARKGRDSTKMTVFNNMVNLANDLLPPAVVKGIKKFRKN